MREETQRLRAERDRSASRGQAPPPTHGGWGCGQAHGLHPSVKEDESSRARPERTPPPPGLSSRVKHERSRADSDSGDEKELKRIDLPPFPNVATLGTWKTKFYNILATVSGRKDETKVLRWVREVEAADSKMEDFGDSKEFVSLDRKLNIAFDKLARDSLEREYNRISAEFLKPPHERLMKGREKYWLFLRHFETNRALGSVYSLADLAKVLWLGDRNIELFLHRWKTTVASVPNLPDDNSLMEMVLLQMEQSHELSIEVRQFRRLSPSNPEKNYAALIDIMESHVQQERQRLNRQSISFASGQGRGGRAFPAVGGSNAMATPEVCRNYLQGRCSRQNCPRLHPEGKEGSEPVSKGSGPGKGKGSSKGKGKGKSRSPSNGPRLPCMAFQNGNCKFGDACRYPHRRATTDEIESLTRIRSLSRGSKGSKGSGKSKSRQSSPSGDRVCFAWKKGQCRFGASCRYQHSDNAAPATSNRRNNRSSSPIGHGNLDPPRRSSPRNSHSPS